MNKQRHTQATFTESNGALTFDSDHNRYYEAVQMDKAAFITEVKD